MGLQQHEVGFEGLGARLALGVPGGELLGGAFGEQAVVPDDEVHGASVPARLTRFGADASMAILKRLCIKQPPAERAPRMLPEEENKLLMETGPGTMMG